MWILTDMYAREARNHASRSRAACIFGRQRDRIFRDDSQCYGNENETKAESGVTVRSDSRSQSRLPWRE